MMMATLSFSTMRMAVCMQMTSLIKQSSLLLVAALQWRPFWDVRQKLPRLIGWTLPIESAIKVC